ncbi:MAG: type II secretion system protein [Candidatus Paceibacterota bacterium]
MFLNHSKNKYPDKNNGFTLIELLVVISIIGVLSTIAMTSLNGARQKAKVAKAQDEVNKLYQILLMYNLGHDNTWPTTNNIDSVGAWNGTWNTYMEDVPADPWGKAYFFDGAPSGATVPECHAGESAICSGGPNGTISSFNRADMKAVGDDICIFFEPEC